MNASAPFGSGNCLPGFGEEVGGVVVLGSEPGMGEVDLFVWVWGEPGGPPAEGAVGDDVVLALAHEVEVGVVEGGGIVIDGGEGDAGGF